MVFDKVKIQARTFFVLSPNVKHVYYSVFSMRKVGKGRPNNERQT